MARPTAYKPEYAEQAAKLCRLGATDVDLADFFGVSTVTIRAWNSRFPEFLSSLKGGKQEADDRVERSLYHRAIGYTFDTVKIMTVPIGNNQGSEVREVPYREHVPPDTTACIFWLKNRQPQAWRDRREVDVNANVLSQIGDDELATVITALRSGSGGRVPATSGNGTGAPKGKGPSGRLSN